MPARLRYFNADEVARELDIDAYGAARVVRELREVEKSLDSISESRINQSRYLNLRYKVP